MFQEKALAVSCWLLVMGSKCLNRCKTTKRPGKTLGFNGDEATPSGLSCAITAVISEINQLIVPLYIWSRCGRIMGLTALTGLKEQTQKKNTLRHVRWLPWSTRERRLCFLQRKRTLERNSCLLQHSGSSDKPQALDSSHAARNIFGSRADCAAGVPAPPCSYPLRRR